MEWIWPWNAEHRNLKISRDLLAASADRRIELEDELRDVRAKYIDALEQLAESRRKEVGAVQAVADFTAQMMFGRKIYMNAPDLPTEEPPTETVMPKRPQARQEVDEYTQQFLDKYELSGIR